MTDPPATRIHIQELDGLRGAAVGLVMVTHFWPNTGVFERSADIAEVGWIGVDLFFVLSGFLITGILLADAPNPNYYRRFYLRRAFRIFPLYYAFLFSLFGFLAVWHGGADLQRLNTEWGSPLWFFAYLANFVTASRGLMPVFGPLGPPWSLQIEEQFYMMFPAIVHRLRERLPRFLIVVIALALVYRVGAFLLYPENPWLQYVGTFGRADALAFGAIVACARRFYGGFAGAWTRSLPLALVPLVAMYAITGVASGGVFVRTAGYSLNAACFAAIIWWTVANAGTRATYMLRFKPLRLLGKISYGVYLLQLPVQSAMKIAMHVPAGNMTRTPSQAIIWTAATLLVAWTSWRVFENPLMVWGQTRFGNRAH